MKKNTLTLVMAIIGLIGCNDKPDIRPANDQMLSVYPNPASHMAHVVVNNQYNQTFTLQVFNIKGKIILEEKGSQSRVEYSVSLANEPVGNYQVILKTGKSVINQKLIKL